MMSVSSLPMPLSAAVESLTSSSDSGGPREDSTGVFNPSPPSAQQSSSPPSKAEEAYVHALLKIPGFESYKYSGSESDLLLLGIKAETSLESISRLAYETKSPGKRQGSIGFVQSACEKLKDISRTRAALIPLISKFDESNRKIARARNEFLQEYEHLAPLLEEITDSLIVQSDRGSRSLIANLRSSLDELMREASASERICDQLTQAQWRLREQEDTFYTQLSGGAEAHDSVASEEDEMFAKVLGRTSLHEATHLRFFTLRQAQSEGPVSTTLSLPQLVLKPTISHKVQDRQPPEAVQLRQDTTRRVGRPDDRHHAPKQKASHEKDIVSFSGAWLDYTCDHKGLDVFAEELRTMQISQQHNSIPDSNDSLIRETCMASPTFMSLKAIRRRDFQRLFGYDISYLDYCLSPEKGYETLSNSKKARSLSNLHVPKIHIRQYIAMWGRDMAQNAILEASRILHFGNIALLRNDSNSLVNIVQDIQNLEVPVGGSDCSVQPFIEVKVESDIGLDRTFVSHRRDTVSFGNHDSLASVMVQPTEI